MKKTWFGLAVAVTLLAATQSESTAAPFYTQQATFNATAIGGGIHPQVVRVNAIGGASYTNHLSATGAVGLGTPFVAVGATPITNVNTAPGGTFAPNFGMGVEGVAVFALGGQVASIVGPAVTGAFTAGTISIYTIPTGTFLSGDPSSWGTGGSLVAQWSVAVPTDVLQGNMDATAGGFPAATINTITINVASALQQQGRLLSDETALGNPGANLLNVTTFDPLSVGDVVGVEQLFSDIAETIQNPGATAFNINAADLALLNAIAAAAGLGGFASGFGDAAGEYNPFSGLTSFDFASVLAAINSPGVQLQAIPEPTSLAVWGLAMGGIALAYRRRRAPKA